MNWDDVVFRWLTKLNPTSHYFNFKWEQDLNVRVRMLTWSVYLYVLRDLLLTRSPALLEDCSQYTRKLFKFLILWIFDYSLYLPIIFGGLIYLTGNNSQYKSLYFVAWHEFMPTVLTEAPYIFYYRITIMSRGIFLYEHRINKCPCSR